ncbi:type I site-specific deoxyribonuclease [Lewinellaceae bacterium SD302]|nr:type I site-specific deoxyribonuclease [Lewinellaceae bacterium SD302]
MSNFNFLKSPWPDLHAKARRVEERVYLEPVSSLQYARLSLEEAVHAIYELELLRVPYNAKLNNLLTQPELVSLLPDQLIDGLHVIRKHGNTAAHAGRNKVTSREALRGWQYLYPFLRWFAVKYSSTLPDPLPPLLPDENLLPRENEVIAVRERNRRLRAMLEEAIKTGEKLEVNFNRLKSSQEKLEATARENAAERERLSAKIKAQRAKVKARKDSRPLEVSSGFSEVETRKHLIDAALAEAGWTDLRDGYELEYPVTGMPPSSSSKNGKGYVDYVLWGDDGRPLALVEAKRTGKEPEAGRHQARLYANALESEFGRRPLIFYTNGYRTMLWDDEFYSAPREVSGFLSKAALHWRIQQRQDRADLRQLSPRADIAGRDYQQEAIRRVAESFVVGVSSSVLSGPKNHKEPSGNGQLNDAPVGNASNGLRGNRRAALLVMATGSGKTRTAVSLVEIMGNNGWAKKILFLADRNALVRQAKKRFNEFLPQFSAVNLSEERYIPDARLVFSTYPTMLNRIDGIGNEDDGPLFGVGHFDLIIVDEAHRSVYNRYRAIFDYFDALVVALTATPKSAIDHNTFELFGCNNEDPTFEYPLERAVEQGYLVNYRNLDVATRFLREGIRYAELSEREKAAYEEEFRDETTGILPEEIAAGAMNKWLFNRDTVSKVLDELMERGLRIEGGDKLGRTIIFAVNKRHAEFIVDCMRERYPELPPDFIECVHNDISHADTLIDNFCNEYEEKMPQVVVSVDMMDTGIDAPRILNLVFFKVVRSYAKFWQMIGRGTRLSPDVFGPGAPKEEFLIFDVCQNFDFFAVNERGYESEQPPSLTEQIFRTRLHLSQLLLQSGDLENARLANELKDLLHAQLSELRGKDQMRRFRVRRQRQHLDNFADRDRWNVLSNDDVGQLSVYVAPLILPEEVDESARRFDLLMLNIQLEAARGNLVRRQQFQEKLMRIADQLQRKYSVPEVMEQSLLIEGLTQPDFYVDITQNELDRIRRDIRELLQYLSGQGRRPAYTNFSDTHLPTEAGSAVTSGSGSIIYRRRVEAYLRENSHHVTIRKLRNNLPITADELNALNELLFRECSFTNLETFQSVFGESPLSTFVGSLLGMEESAARDAFADFLRTAPLNANQITFVDYIISYLSLNGKIEPKMLFKAPFTDLHDGGITGIFDDAQARRLIRILKDRGMTA